jgi:NADH:ubiquinone reductase (H+-translocating)
MEVSAVNGARHILIVGAGYVGMYTALRLRRKLRRELRSGTVTMTVVDPQSYMTYQPFLPEAAAGNLEPRHVVAPLRRVLPEVELLNGRVVRVDHARRRAEVEPVGHEPVGSHPVGGDPVGGDPVDHAATGPDAGGIRRTLSYDILVMAPGSIARTLPIPGLAENGVGFKTVEEAIYLRNHVLSRLDLAATTSDPDVRRKALTFVFVGGGFAGVEALAELEDMAADACATYPGIEPADMRWVLVEATDRVLPEVGRELGRYTVDALRHRGIDVRLRTRLTSAEDHHIVLSDGTEFDAGTLVWTAGVKAHPLLQATDLPLDAKGRLVATAELTVADDAYAAGDCAAVPDLTEPGTFCAPNAQHAVRQARVLADNIVARLRGRPPRTYRHRYVGSVASLGLHRGVAQLYGIRLRGFPAWFIHRTYHLSRMPTLNRKVRVVADWTLALFFRREIVSLGALQRPREEFEWATRPQLEDGRLRAMDDRTPGGRRECETVSPPGYARS